MMRYVRAFTDKEALVVQAEIEQLVRALQGRKLEEGDWTELYCRVKGAPCGNWSNLPFRDFLYGGVGVEFKLLKRVSPSQDFGKSLMHPAATRTIDFNEKDPPEKAMTDVFRQWNRTITEFEERVRKTSPSGQADIRWGVLLWAQNHKEYLYFEEKIEKPNPSDYYAIWSDGNHRGKPTRNLHIYEKLTEKKRFSCTVPKNGPKLQPYFDIPTIEHGAHLFKIDTRPVAPIYVNVEDKKEFEKLFPQGGAEKAFREMLNLWSKKTK